MGSFCKPFPSGLTIQIARRLSRVGRATNRILFPVGDQLPPKSSASGMPAGVMVSSKIQVQEPSDPSTSATGAKCGEQITAPVGAGLAVNRAEVVLDGVGGDVERSGEHLGGSARVDEFQKLCFAGC
jgi:hypothetical protein